MQVKVNHADILQLTMWIEPLALVGIDQTPSLWHDHLRTLDKFVKIKFDNNTGIYKVGGAIWRQIVPLL